MRYPAAVFLVTAFLSVLAVGQETKKAGKAAPTDQEVASLAGARLAKVFAKFGAPQDMFPTDADSDAPNVCLDYGSFGFLVYKKTVQSCLFWEEWKGDACGVKVGETADAIIKKLGKPDNVNKEDDGRQRLYWDYKANDEIMRLQVTCDKDQKCTRIVLNVK